MKTCFHSHFYANFHSSVTLVFFIGFSRNVYQNVELIYTFFGSFCLFLNWEGAIIRPQIRPREIPVINLISSLTDYFTCMDCLHNMNFRINIYIEFSCG